MFAKSHDPKATQRVALINAKQVVPSFIWWRYAMPFWLVCLLALIVPTAASSHGSSVSMRDDAPAQINVCAGCHGSQGAGSSSGIPRIAGMNADYLSHQLSMFKAGTRTSNIMQPIAQTLSDADIDTFSHYFSSQHPPLAASLQSPSPDAIAAGHALATSGDKNGLPACFSCHAEGGVGNGQRFPSIAGEPAVFVVSRLHEFQARARTNGAKPGSMTEVASKLTEAQIQEAAAYLSVTAPK